MSSNNSKGATYKGLKELISFNNKLSSLLTQASNEALKQQGGVLLGATQRAVPVRTGRLKRSGGQQAGNLFLSVYYDAPYARFVDLGTRRMAARNYFFRVLQPNESKVLSAINQRVGQIIKSNLGKG
jgi:HK97 gp10 family phage protein